MNRNDASDVCFPAVIAVATMLVALFSCVAMLVVEEEYNELCLKLLRETLVMIRESRRRKRRLGGDIVDGPRKKSFIKWDRDRARQCIEEDYLGAVPRFCNDDFKRMFRISRANYDRLRAVLCAADPFFRDRYDATKRMSISIDAKILIALKYMAYGTAINAFRDYFQMVESTSRLCLRHFVKGVLHCDNIRGKYFRSMSPSDAKRVEKLHHDIHGVHGMAFSLDCSHFRWAKCPMQYHGQYKGKEEGPTVVVEAGCDYNLWFWHCVFGYVGTMNDINIWDSSKLHMALHNGSFEPNDFPFVIGGESFNKLWFLTDGIYPEISRFVKTISEPLNKWEALFAIWQEAKRKDVERGFGVLKRKFGYLQTPFQMFDIEEIAMVVYCCFILHNMAVEERIVELDDSVECADFYECVELNEEVVGPEHCPGTLLAMAYVQAENENLNDRQLEIQRLRRLGIDIFDPTLQQRELDVNVLDITSRLAHHQWKALYNYDEHKRLQRAIVVELREKYSSI